MVSDQLALSPPSEGGLRSTDLEKVLTSASRGPDLSVEPHSEIRGEKFGDSETKLRATMIKRDRHIRTTLRAPQTDIAALSPSLKKK